MRVRGFYGHIQRNDWLAAVMFAGFALALQVLAAVALFLPLLMFDLDHAPVYDFAGYAARYAGPVLVLSAIAFAVQFFLYVRSVKVEADFRYVERRTHPRLVNIVETLAIGAGLPYPEVGLIDTDARNAFACGITASSAVVVATKGLVDALDDDELSAVIAHEIAHIRNGDIRLMAAANVAMSSFMHLRTLNVLRIEDWRQVYLFVVVPPFLLLFLVSGFLSGLSLLLARVSRLMIASSREMVADAEAVRMTHNPSALISALRKIEGYSTVAGIGPQADAMMIDGAVEGPLATHPTIAERIDVLTRLSGEMATTGGVRKDTRPLAFRPNQGAVAFGRRGVSVGAAAMVAMPPADPGRTLFGRVSTGTGIESFGLRPAMGGLLLLGVAAMVLIYPKDFRDPGSFLARFDPIGINKMIEPVLDELKYGPAFARRAAEDR